MGIYWNQGIISPPWSVVQATKFDTIPVLAKCSECVSLELLLCMELLQSGRYDVIISKQGLINDSSN